jgi:hypothetical protein
MIFDKYISYDLKVVVAIIFAGLWIYFRTPECYSLIPRQHIFPVVFVMTWAYLNYYEPLMLPIGLAILVLYPVLLSKGFLKYLEKTT